MNRINFAQKYYKGWEYQFKKNKMINKRLNNKMRKYNWMKRFKYN